MKGKYKVVPPSGYDPNCCDIGETVYHGLRDMLRNSPEIPPNPWMDAKGAHVAAWKVEGNQVRITLFEHRHETWPAALI